MPLPEEYKYLLKYSANESTQLYNICAHINDISHIYLCGGPTLYYLDIEGEIKESIRLEGSNAIRIKPLVSGDIALLDKPIALLGYKEICLEIEALGYITKTTINNKC
jgi:hypothetical protein